MVIRTFGRNTNSINATKKLEKKFPTLKFKNVNKTGSSFRNMLEKTKNIALGPQMGQTVKCNRARCKSCNLMSQKNHIMCNKKKYFSAFGSCLSKNIIYNAQCKLCDKMYVGKTTCVIEFQGIVLFFMNAFPKMETLTVSALLMKMSSFWECIYTKNMVFPLGRHLINHTFLLFCKCACSPKNIDVQEHKWIQKLKCVAPYGLNSNDPFGISIKY